MALSADRNLNFFTTPELVEIPLDDNVLIYKGAFVGRNAATGYARPLVAGDAFLGVAYAQADNTITGHTAGGVSVKLHQSIDIIDTVFGASQNTLGAPVFATADDALSMSGVSRVGRIVAIESTNVARVRCQPIAHAPGVYERGANATVSASGGALSIDQLNRDLFISNSGAVTVTLPPVATAGAGAWFRLTKLTATGAITIDPNASETINGSATYAGVDAQYDTVHVVCTGTAWVIVARDLA